MRIQIASDLHLEFAENREWIKKNPLIPEADVLVLAGDIVVNKYDKEVDFFFDYVTNNFRYVIATPGNHEFYHDTINHAYPSFQRQIAGNYILLNNMTYVIDDTKFIASILWSHIPGKYKEDLTRVMNDFRYIYKWQNGMHANIDIDDFNDFHRQSREFIETELDKNFDGKVVVITHHLPCFECIEKDYNNKETLQYAFATDLNELIARHDISLWVFGHIHESFNRTISNTKVIANPLGYMNESQKLNFSRNLVIEI